MDAELKEGQVIIAQGLEETESDTEKAQMIIAYAVSILDPKGYSEGSYEILDKPGKSLEARVLAFKQLETLIRTGITTWIEAGAIGVEVLKLLGLEYK